jgi:hypothetical protein
LAATTHRSCPLFIVLFALMYCPAHPAAAGDTAVDSTATSPPSGADLQAADRDTTAYPWVPYGVGEKLVFSIDYGPVNAGEGTLEVLGIVQEDGHECYQIESRATSNRFFSTFYKVRDRAVTHIDRRRLFSRFFEKRLREGTYTKHEEVHFDQEGIKAQYQDGRVFDTMPGIQDVLSAFYYARTRDLEVGQQFGILTHSSRKDYSLEVFVHGRETVQVPAGIFDCFIVEPVILGDGLFQHEGKLTIWLTADERKLPVLMKTKVKVGSIDASLKEFTLGVPVTDHPTSGP